MTLAEALFAVELFIGGAAFAALVVFLVNRLDPATAKKGPPNGK